MEDHILDSTLMSLESNIAAAEIIVESLQRKREEINNEIDTYLYNINNQVNVWNGRTIVLKNAKNIIDGINTSEKEWRSKVLLRDKFTCQRCSSKQNPTCHHITPKSICSDELRWDPSNGIVLCKECHHDWHEIVGNTPISSRVFTNWLSGIEPRKARLYKVNL